MEVLPLELQIAETTQLDVAIPGWHINGHGEVCRTNFNLSYMEGAGRTVGEDVETTWAGTNLLAPSVCEMGPAAWQDTLNDLRCFLEAFTMKEKQLEIFDQLSATFTPEIIAKWEKMVVTWYCNSTAANPYKEPGCSMYLVLYIIIQ